MRTHPAAELSDEQLVAYVRATDDRGAFGLLVARHQGALLAFLTRHTGRVEHAEDLAQEALIKAYDRLDEFRVEATFRTWLFRIAIREFLQAERKAGAVRRMTDRLRGDAEVDADEPSCDSIAALDLQRALLGLDPNERTAVLLSDACGMSNTDVAEAMDAPLGSVKTYIRRARGKLGLAIGDAYDD